MRIVADPNIPFVREAFAALGDVCLVPGRQISADDVRDANVLLVRSVTPVHATLLDGCPVRFVATATIGTDHVDEAYLQTRGIGFASAVGSNANSVAEYIVAAMLTVAHRHEYRLRDKILGVVGVGNVGSRVVRYAEALGMQVLQNDPPRQRAEGLAQFVSLDRIIAEADIITLHVPLTREGPDATYHLFDAARLAALERRPLLINSARGTVVDNVALVAAFHHRNWKIAGAVLDVWENEPKISIELLNLAELGTPHIAGYSFDGKVSGTRMIYEAVCRHFAITPTWQPELPPPPVPEIELSASMDDEEDVLARAIAQVYDITADDAALREDPTRFDRLRADYPMRREFFNTVIQLRGAPESLKRRFTQLGFRL